MNLIYYFIISYKKDLITNLKFSCINLISYNISNKQVIKTIPVSKGTPWNRCFARWKMIYVSKIASDDTKKLLSYILVFIHSGYEFLTINFEKLLYNLSNIIL
jgi:hypothetical protein